MAKLKIGPLVFDVSYVSDPLFDEDDEEIRLYGKIKFLDQVILIDRTLPEIKQRITLLHEALHAIDIEYQTKLSEPTITCLANGIIDALQRNKWFRDKILNV